MSEELKPCPEAEWRRNGWKAARKAAAREAERWSHNMGGDEGLNIARRIRALKPETAFAPDTGTQKETPRG